jgi:hypothetical protein
MDFNRSLNGVVVNPHEKRPAATAATAAKESGNSHVEQFLLKSVNVFKTVNYVNYEFSGERWIAGSDIRVSGFPSVTWHINTPSLQSRE